jgi:hypothetical protein
MSFNNDGWCNCDSRGKYDDGTKMILNFVYEIIFMNNVNQFKKYYHGMSVTPAQPNCCQQHYIFI